MKLSHGTPAVAGDPGDRRTPRPAALVAGFGFLLSLLLGVVGLGVFFPARVHAHLDAGLSLRRAERPVKADDGSARPLGTDGDPGLRGPTGIPGEPGRESFLDFWRRVFPWLPRT